MIEEAVESMPEAVRSLLEFTRLQNFVSYPEMVKQRATRPAIIEYIYFHFVTNELS